MKGTKEKFSTFFPKDWSRKKVIEKILEALQDAISKKNMGLNKNNNYEFEGRTSEGIKIITVINSSLDRMISAYPDWK